MKYLNRIACAAAFAAIALGSSAEMKEYRLMGGQSVSMTEPRRLTAAFAINPRGQIGGSETVSVSNSFDVTYNREYDVIVDFRGYKGMDIPGVVVVTNTILDSMSRKLGGEGTNTFVTTWIKDPDRKSDINAYVCSEMISFIGTEMENRPFYSVSNILYIGRTYTDASPNSFKVKMEVFVSNTVPSQVDVPVNFFPCKYTGTGMEQEYHGWPCFSFYRETDIGNSIWPAGTFDVNDPIVPAEATAQGFHSYTRLRHVADRREVRLTPIGRAYTKYTQRHGSHLVTVPVGTSTYAVTNGLSVLVPAQTEIRVQTSDPQTQVGVIVE